MKKIIMFAILLGGIANAQTFDFSCDRTGTANPNSSYNLETNVLIIDGNEFTGGVSGGGNRLDVDWLLSTWSTNGAINVRFVSLTSNWLLSQNGVNQFIDSNFQNIIDELISRKEVVLPNIVSGENFYNPNADSRALHINGENWTVQADSFNLSGDYFSNSIGTATITPNTNGEDAFSLSFHSGSIIPDGSSGLTLANMAIELMNYLPVDVIRSGQDLYDVENSRLRIDGNNWVRQDNGSYRYFADNYYLDRVQSVTITPNGGDSFNIEVLGRESVQGAPIVLLAANNIVLRAAAREVVKQKYTTRIFDNFEYDSRGDKHFTYRGIGWDRSSITGGTRFNAPQGIRDIDRWARISFDVLDNGNFRFAFQNDGINGNGAEGHHGEHAFDVTLASILSILPNHIFYADRNGAYVNNRLLTQWDNNSSGWTREPIHGRTYPGNFRFTRNGGNWDIILERNGVGKTYQSNRTEAQVRAVLLALATTFTAAYDGIADLNSFENHIFIYQSVIWTRTTNGQFGPRWVQPNSPRDIIVEQNVSGGWTVHYDSGRFNSYLNVGQAFARIEFLLDE